MFQMKKISLTTILVVVLLGFIMITFFLPSKEGFIASNDTGTVIKGPNSSTVYLVGDPVPGAQQAPQQTQTQTQTQPYDNYNHYQDTGSRPPTVFYGYNGSKAVVTKYNGNYIIAVTDTAGSTTIYSSSSAATEAFVNVTFSAPDGSSAQVVLTSAGYTLNVQQADGREAVYSPTTTDPTSSSNTSTTTTTTDTGTVNSASNASYSAGVATGPAGNTTAYVSGPENTAVATTAGQNTYDYSSVYPQGVSRAMIPPGQEDLYILKSEIVPPVCPACPQSSVCPRQQKCPACPACARCPESPFDCKKVPNYRRINNAKVPSPSMNDFTSYSAY